MKLYNILWIIPFLSFTAGYLLVRTFLHTPSFQVPTIVGSTLYQAAISLSNNNLNLRILQQKEDPDLPDGTIMSQNPHHGQLVKERQSIFVTVSKQPPIAKTPNCINQSITPLKKDLKEKNIKFRIFHMQSNQPKNTCFAQIPESQSPLTDNSMILYMAQSNPKQIVWPRFIGHPAAQIIDFLQQYDITPQITHNPPAKESHTCDTCIITDQRPLAGTLLCLDPENPPFVQLRVQ